MSGREWQVVASRSRPLRLVGLAGVENGGDDVERPAGRQIRGRCEPSLGPCLRSYSSDTARASVRVQLAPLERLGPERSETAIRTLAAFLDELGSIGRTAARQRLALQLACRGLQ